MQGFRTTFAIVILSALGQTAVADGPTNEQVREAVGRALPFMEKEGTAWIKNRQCISCHQLPFMVWTLSEAQRQKFTVDTDKLAVWSAWSLDHALNRNVFYKLTDASLAALRKAEMPDADVTKLQELKNKSFVTEAEFRQEVGKRLAAETAAKHQEVLLKSAALPNQGGGGGNSQNQYMATLVATPPYAAKVSEEVRQALAAGLVKSQQKNGSWAAAGQFLAQKRSATESVEAVTLWSILALASVERPSEAVVQAGVRARAFVKDAKPGVSTETLLLQALVAHLDGDTKRSEALAEELIKGQHDDGGWSWLKSEAKSDAYATGEVLYALRVLGRPVADASVQKARKYLLETQRSDGTWFLSMKTISTTKKEETKAGDLIYSYWTTGWAVIGLMRTLE